MAATTENRTLARFVTLVIAAGLLVLCQALTQAPAVPRPLEWMALAVLAVACAPFSLRVPGAPVHASLSDTFLFSLVVLYGPAPAVVAIAVDGLVVSWRRGHSSQRMLFNLANPALAMWLGGQTFVVLTGWLGESRVLGLDAATPALFAMASVHFLVSSSLIAIATSLDRGGRAVDLWRHHFLVLSLSHGASASAALFVLQLARSAGVVAVIAVAPVVGMIYLGLQARFGRLADAEQHVDRLDRLYLSTIKAFSTAIEAKDSVTSSHVHRVQRYSLSLAGALGVTDPIELKAIEAAALLHDTGKLAVPEYILNKPGKLTVAEFEQMKLHVEVGTDILSSIDFPYPVVPIVHAHHECWDGSGYPRGLRGEEIPLGARILSVVDCYDALASDRPYRMAMTQEAALSHLRERRGTMYDANVVDAFTALLPTLHGDTGPEPDLQRAVSRIRQAALRDMASSGQAVAAAEATHGSSAVVESLSRVLSGTPRVADLVQLVAPELQRVCPGAWFVYYVVSTDGQLEATAFVGATAEPLPAPTMMMGERVSGWAAATRRQVVNAEARLDLGGLAGTETRQFCLATPIVHADQLVGVLTAYGPVSFTDEGARGVWNVAGGLASMLARALTTASQTPPAKRPSRANLRVASSR